MSGEPWRFAFASTVGTSHIKVGLPCQDASACLLVPTAEGQTVLVALLADGAGSASRAEAGAQLACTFLLGEITAALAAGAALTTLTREAIADLLRQLQARIGQQAEAEGRQARDFAATLVAAVVGAREAVFFQVGDGAIVVSTPEDGDAYSWVFWPGSGEYENTTFFLTDADVERHLEWERSEQPVDQVALFSDGLQRLALHYQSRTAHAPFFRSKMQVLEAAEDAAPARLSEQLARFLSSPEVNARTDDDKTLILATRRRPTPPLGTADAGADGLR
ncbi:MAG TPA: PP2C family serine/threonine-protein phosphatase [Thermoanaerobaculia bacterium]|nr:PP2C family serine/threonine-protein phosphatase [Thermoanaerobaculia bacterium]